MNKINLRLPLRAKPGGQNILDYSSIVIARVCLGVLIIGVLVVFLFLNTYSGKATIFEWMLACLLFGLFIGFLFGIPKILQGGSQNAPHPAPAPDPRNPAPAPGEPAGALQPPPANPSQSFTYQQQVNTNLTEISDWLTKIIVGLGLVNLKNIPTYLRTVATILAKALILNKVTENVAFAFAYATIVTYTLLGFLFGYIITRVFLAALFLDADRRSLDIDRLNFNILRFGAVARSANNKADLALQTSAVGPQNQGVGVVQTSADQQLDGYINEYNDTRQNMPSGDPRTAKMTSIYAQMIKVIGNTTVFDPAAAIKDSNNPGRRLAAFAYYFVKPDANQLDAVIDALVTDPLPFNQYYAIQTLKQLLAQQGSRVLNFAQFNKLKTYHDKLANGEDRKFELENILPNLKT